MLKWLELIGFKSFADRTRFEFDRGITGIVGPNGSGKSNVIDAVRWILGEQSAKNLRGSEMADVIFNGSATRRSLGMAEVSLCFDNRNKHLPIERDEVVLTRRVYRSGEGEYLVNGQLARLRDIRGLFLGTGAGAGAYSIIAQGKVDLMLQSSTKDRRHIFEEAAGISRFKARKIEALRRLERVDQNLLRLQDIFEEVEKQLRSLRYQAARARSYKQYFDRLKELRLRFGLAEHHSHRLSLAQSEEEVGRAKAIVTEAASDLEREEQRFRFVDETLTQLDASIQRTIVELSETREKMSSLEADNLALWQRDAELEQELRDGADRLGAVRRRFHSAHAEAEQWKERLHHDETGRKQLSDRLAEQQRETSATVEQLQRLRQEQRLAIDQSNHLLRDLSRFENEQAGLESQLNVLWQQQHRLQLKLEGITRRIMHGERQAADWLCVAVGIAGQRGQFSQRIDAARHKQALAQAEWQQARAQLEAAQRHQSELASRHRLLESFIERQEGLDRGVREALHARAAGEPAWQAVYHVLAECISVPAPHANVVELALGMHAQALLLRSADQMTLELVQAARALSSPVHFLVIDDDARNDRLVVFGDEMEWTSLASLVQCDDVVRPLVDRLLGSTFLVPDFASAHVASQHDADLRFVTAQGDLFAADGLVTVGSARPSGGILARAAELHDLERQLQQSAARIESLQQAVAHAQEQVSRADHALEVLLERDADLQSQIARLENLRGQLRTRNSSSEQEWKNTRDELDWTHVDIRQVDVQYVETERKLAALHELIRDANARRSQLDDEVAGVERVLASAEAVTATTRTELAILDERLSSLRARVEKATEEAAIGQQELSSQLARIEQARRRRHESSARLLSNHSVLAQLYLDKDQIAGRHGHRPGEQDSLRRERKELGHRLQERRRVIDAARGTIHTGELRISQLRMANDVLLARTREDYGVDLGDLYTTDYQPPPADELEQGRREIDELRERVSRLGNVNLQAVEELDGLEQRSGTLRFQIDDLETAKRHLLEVIEKINVESRRLFLDTFQTVREHFANMFRKLFGGGKADIVLEDENDVLESGIEIIARPPGKEPSSISLLSGGEKTMTAVALIMALFRSKPSPYCILDEVDAALDEANIGRFVDLVREFLDQSQFIVVTHSKTTMTAADVLHGVTQRESGVSLRVSIRLEDVSEDGQLIDPGAQTGEDQAGTSPARDRAG